MAQRVGRGIALLFHDRGTRRGWVVSSTPRPHFTLRKDQVPIVQEAGWARGTVWTGGKSRPHRELIPDRPARSQSLHRLSYRAHKSQINRTMKQLTNCMKQKSLWEANRFSASEKIPCILWNTKVHYRNHKCLTPVPILNQINPVHASSSHFLKIYFNIILPSKSMSCKWSPSLWYPHQNPVYSSPVSHTATFPTHLIPLDLITREV